MNLKTLSITVIACCFIAACTQSNDEYASDQAAADKVYINGKVYTVNTAQPWADAVAITDGKIVFVGDDQKATDFIGKNTNVVDMQGGMLLPGFQDAHVHPLEGASLETFMGCDLTTVGNDRNPENWVDYLQQCKSMVFPHDWVLGGGHDMADLLSLKRHPKLVLDDIFGDMPVAFMEKTSHSMWVNSAALKRAGITKDTPNPQGGIIFKDPITKEPTGILSDSAGDELMHLALVNTPQLEQARYEALLASQDYMVSYGITSATNARLYWNRGNHLPWLRAEEEGTLKTRSIMALWTYPHMDDDYQLAQLKSMYADNKNSLLRWSMVKFYSDGVVSNNSAAVTEEYNYLIHPDSKPLGLNYFSQARMARYITELEKYGFDVHIHALGDRGIRESLNAIEIARKNNPELAGIRRHQVTHLSVMRKSEISRFAELDVTANFQVNYPLDFLVQPIKENIDYDNVSISDEDFWYKILGPIDVLFLPVIEVLKANGRVVLSSDWDVADINPLVSIANIASLTKSGMTHGELVAFGIKAYTLNAAYVMGHDDMTGSIEVGKYADLALLNNNIFELDYEHISKAKVMQSLLEGRVVYQRE
jgi:predicted amidohydrolase YtcJ